MPHTRHEFNLLLIEDNAGDARLIREMLLSRIQERVSVVWAATLRDGLERALSETFDAILLDLSLPDSHGIETLGKAREQVPQLPIIVLTGNQNEDLGILAVQQGAQDYLSKDEVDGKLLMRTVRYAMQRHQTETELRQSKEEYRSLIDDVFNTSMVAVIILDHRFCVVWCNEATEIYFGIPRERLIGKDKRKLIDEELKCVFADPDDYSVHLLHAYEAHRFTERFECHVTPEGSREERWLEHWSQPIHNGMYAGGRIEQYTDITDRKLLEIAEQQQRHYAEALRDIAALLTSSLNLHEVLERILNNLGRVVPHHLALILIQEDQHIWIARHKSEKNSKNDTQEIVTDREIQATQWRQLQEMFDHQRWLILGDADRNMTLTALAAKPDYASYVGVPIQLQNETLGFVNLFGRTTRFYDESDAERLSAFAELAAIAIQNARLYEQSQALAAMEERQRLARDLHDSVSQTLFTCRAMAESALKRWQKDPQRAHELMEQVYQLTITALAEMRILLLELRPAALTQISLKQLFEQYLQPIQERQQFKLELVIEDVPQLPPEVQIAFYRITQEGLNNIDKHAQASHVNVHVTQAGDEIKLKITDNGIGFNRKKIAATSMGLGIMQERARKIGASFEIESEIGSGTSITIIWNLKASDES